MSFDEHTICSLIELVGDPLPIPFEGVVDAGDGVMDHNLASFT